MEKSTAMELFRRLKQGLHDEEEDHKIVMWLSDANYLLLPSSVSRPSKLQMLSGSEEDVLELRLLVKTSAFMTQQILELIIQKLTLEWISKIKHENFKRLVKPLFLKGFSGEEIFTLTKAIGSLSKDYRFSVCVSLLEDVVSVEYLTQLLQDQILRPPERSLRAMGSTGSCDKDQGHGVVAGDSSSGLVDDRLIGCLVSLPEKMANRLQNENSDKFYPSSYIPALSSSILNALEYSHTRLTSSKDIYLATLSGLVGRLCLAGYADLFYNTVLPHLCMHVREDFAWPRICVRVFTGVPGRCLEATLQPLLLNIPWYGLVEKFLGDSVATNSTIKMLLCTKLVFHKSFAKPKLLLHNIVGYLSQPTRKHLYIEMLQKLLGVWGSVTSMKVIPGEQHLYLSRAIMVCVGALSQTDKKTHKDDFLRDFLPCVTAHLESTNHSLRLLAMCVAKRLTNTLDPTGPQLEFELDMTVSEVKDLLSYEGLPPDPGATIKKDMVSKQKDSVLNSVKGIKLEEPAKTNEKADSDLDSDDDLVPYDMSNDTTVSDTKPPRYLRDCMEGLISNSENVEKAEICLQHAERLIRQRSSGIEEIAPEFTKILLHLQECGALVDFWGLRKRAMVALCVVCPVPVADYLTSQFYEKNYSLRQRLDILEVLSGAAMELSQPEGKTTGDKDKKIVEIKKNTEEEESWKDIVQKRIDSNTRRFASPSAPPPPAQVSRFSPVCGHFLYGLMTKADHRQCHLDLLGADAPVLHRLLYTLALVVHQASHAPTVTQMGQTLLDFTWPLRGHTDQCVRQAVLSCTTSVFLSVPAHAVGEMVGDCPVWLEEVMHTDADTHCQRLAAQGLMVLQEQLKKGMERCTET